MPPRLGVQQALLVTIIHSVTYLPRRVDVHVRGGTACRPTYLPHARNFAALLMLSALLARPLSESGDYLLLSELMPGLWFPLSSDPHIRLGRH